MLCREHGQQLTALAAEYNNNNNNVVVAFWGTVKETGVDDAGLEEFHSQYFPFPLYLDEELKFYEAFGKGSIFAGMSLWNPIKIYRGMKEIGKRLKEKKIEGIPIRNFQFSKVPTKANQMRLENSLFHVKPIFAKYLLQIVKMCEVHLGKCRGNDLLTPKYERRETSR